MYVLCLCRVICFWFMSRWQFRGFQPLQLLIQESVTIAHSTKRKLSPQGGRNLTTSLLLTKSQNPLFLAPEVQWASKFTVFVRFHPRRPRAVSGVGEKSERARKKFGRRKVKKAKKSPKSLKSPAPLTAPGSLRMVRFTFPLNDSNHAHIWYVT